MNVNGITSAQATTAYQNQTDKTVKKTTSDVNTTPAVEETGVVYEPSKEAKVTKKKYQPDTNLIAKLKADAEQRQAQLRTLVEQMMSKQTNAYGQANDIWKFLASGNYTVDPATKAQAQADIAEDGYWGVEQTSDRIISFATALTGGDPDKIEEMRDAFIKGFKQAEEMWGGKLPDISQKTYDAVMEKFDNLATSSNEQTEE